MSRFFRRTATADRVCRAAAAVPAAGAVLACVVLAAPAGAATSASGPGTGASSAPGYAPASGSGRATNDSPAHTRQQADTVEDTVRRVLDLQLLQPACGERGALQVAVVDALRAVGVDVRASGLPRIDLGPLGTIDLGAQHPGRAVGVELHLLPGVAPVNVTINGKPCHSSPSTTPGGHRPAEPGTRPSTVPRPSHSAQPSPSTSAPVLAAAAAPQAGPRPAQPELAQTGGGTPTWPFLTGAGVLLAGGAWATVVAARRRRGAGGPA